jgi:hypothetical protein
VSTNSWHCWRHYGVCDQKTSKFFVSHQEESMAGHVCVNRNLLKVRGRKNKRRAWWSPGGIWRPIKRCFSSPGALKTYINLWKGRTRWFPSNNLWVGRAWAVHGQVRVCHYLAPLTSEPGRGAGWIPVYPYVNSQVPHSWERKVPILFKLAVVKMELL